MSKYQTWQGLAAIATACLEIACMVFSAAPSSLAAATACQSTALQEAETYICYYGSTFTPKLAEYDVAIVSSDALPQEELASLRAQGTTVLIYLSVGEEQELRKGDGTGPGGYASWYINDGDGRPQQNEEWQSYYANAGDPQWQTEVLREAQRLLAGEADGLFLDTLETYDVAPQTKKGTIALVRALRERFPGALLVANRGMEILPDIAADIDGQMFECFSSDYDFERQTYHLLASEDMAYTAQQAAKINILRKQYPFVVFSLDYALPGDMEQIAACVRRAKEYGFLSYVSTIHLDQVYPPQ